MEDAVRQLRNDYSTLAAWEGEAMFALAPFEAAPKASKLLSMWIAVLYARVRQAEFAGRWRGISATSRTAVVFALCILPSTIPAAAQEAGPQLSPSESLRAAMDPFEQARSQNNDLTEADRLALSLGMARASRDCVALTAAPQGFAKDAGQWLALGRLCVFGQQFEPARAALVNYLAVPAAPEREAALGLLVRAFLGLNEQGSAYAQVLSLLSDFPYDAQTHLAADLVISASECWTSDPDKELNDAARDLCDQQRKATLPLLEQGKALAGKEGEVAASRLYADALRCVALARSRGDKGADEELAQLAAIAQQPNWQHTAELALMREALARAEMVGQATPLGSLHAHQLNANGALLPRTLFLRHGQAVLVAFSLWSPNAGEQIRALARSAPPRSIYAVTSWSANSGGEDAPAPRMKGAMLSWQKSLPIRIPLLIVPDAELREFHADQYPAGIAIRDGIVVSNTVLADDGAVRMTVAAMGNESAKAARHMP